MMYLVKLVKMRNYSLDSLITMTDQYALKALQHVVIDDFDIHIKNKNKNDFYKNYLYDIVII